MISLASKLPIRLTFAPSRLTQYLTRSFLSASTPSSSSFATASSAAAFETRASCERSVPAIGTTVAAHHPHRVTSPDTSSTKHHSSTPRPMHTRIVAIDASKVGRITGSPTDPSGLQKCPVEWNTSSQDYANLKAAARLIQTTDVPVAFPTETVYGLGADARRDGAVKGIFAAKNRPSDNPLIVHVDSLDRLRGLLRSGDKTADVQSDPIPSIYMPLIERFWPGPLSIILPLSRPTKTQSQPDSGSATTLSPFTTAGLSTFGARMPATPLCRMLIQLADAPLAAPSANASTRPSPTQAIHVLEDLEGRIEMIVDGGSCDVGVESTVVDGISSDVPTILRPGGIGLAELRSCPGWENVQIGYKNKAEGGIEEGEKKEERLGMVKDGAADNVPRAPGMKYKHYSPRARVRLYEATAQTPSVADIAELGALSGGLGIIRTRRWAPGIGLGTAVRKEDFQSPISGLERIPREFKFTVPVPRPDGSLKRDEAEVERTVQAWEISLGSDPVTMAHGLFAAFRDLDRLKVDVILVEGIDENGEDEVGGVATAVMNRLRKAAESVN